MNNEDDFFEFLVYLQDIPRRGPRRFIRDMANPLHFYSDKDFIMRYR